MRAQFRPAADRALVSKKSMSLGHQMVKMWQRLSMKAALNLNGKCEGNRKQNVNTCACVEGAMPGNAYVLST